MQYGNTTESKNKHRAWVVDESKVEICLGTAQTSLRVLIRHQCGPSGIATEKSQ